MEMITVELFSPKEANNQGNVCRIEPLQYEIASALATNPKCGPDYMIPSCSSWLVWSEPDLAGQSNKHHVNHESRNLVAYRNAAEHIGYHHLSLDRCH